MKLFSPSSTPPSRATARNATLLNLFATPGLGSLIGRRWLAGSGQLVLFLTGFVLFCVWNFNIISNFYKLAFSDYPPPVDHSGNTAWAAVTLCVAAWLWSMVTSLSLMREAGAGRQQSLENFAAPPTLKLADTKILTAMAAIPNWQLSGGKITRTYEFKDFPAAIKFVETIGAIAEQAWHHPDIDIRLNKVTLTLTTHDAGGLTEKDFKLARQFDQL